MTSSLLSLTDNSGDISFLDTEQNEANRRKCATFSPTPPMDNYRDIPVNFTTLKEISSCKRTTYYHTLPTDNSRGVTVSALKENIEPHMSPTDNTRDARRQSSTHFRIHGLGFLDVPLGFPAWMDNSREVEADNQSKFSTSSSLTDHIKGR